MRLAKLLVIYSIFTVVLPMIILTHSVAFSKDAPGNAPLKLTGDREIDGMILKAILATYGDFEKLLKGRKKHQHGADAGKLTDISEYRIVVEQDQDNFYINYFTYETVFGGQVKYVVSRKTFKLISKNYSR
ncbi:MAG: hypothetical protein AB9866_16085 [Syntrophobacteraceae bacterium]